MGSLPCSDGLAESRPVGLLYSSRSLHWTSIGPMPPHLHQIDLHFVPLRFSLKPNLSEVLQCNNEGQSLSAAALKETFDFSIVRCPL